MLKSFTSKFSANYPYNAQMNIMKVENYLFKVVCVKFIYLLWWEGKVSAIGMHDCLVCGMRGQQPKQRFK